MTKEKKEELIESLIHKGKVTTKIIESKGKNKNVMAFDEDNKNHVKDIDWETMKNRNIYMKLTTIFEAMKWDIRELI